MVDEMVPPELPGSDDVLARNAHETCASEGVGEQSATRSGPVPARTVAVLIEVSRDDQR